MTVEWYYSFSSCLFKNGIDVDVVMAKREIPSDRWYYHTYYPHYCSTSLYYFLISILSHQCYKIVIGVTYCFRIEEDEHDFIIKIKCRNLRDITSMFNISFHFCLHINNNEAVYLIVYVGLLWKVRWILWGLSHAYECMCLHVLSRKKVLPHPR